MSLSTPKDNDETINQNPAGSQGQEVGTDNDRNGTPEEEGKEATPAEGATSENTEKEKVKKKKKKSSSSKKAMDDMASLALDPFAIDDLKNQESVGSAPDIHIRLQQRNGRKTLTTLQGLPKQHDYKAFLKTVKKNFACNGTLIEDPNLGTVIQLQGDQRKNLKDYLEEQLKLKGIKVHGA